MMTEGSMDNQQDILEEIAIIGMAGRFPGADNINQFWQNLRNGKESISRFTDEELLSRGVAPEQLAKPNYVKAGCLLSNIDMFDAAFFGYSAGDATTMDPQHRIFLEICWEAMESAGYIPDTYPGAIGVFGGTSNSGFAHLLYTGHNQHTATERFNLMLGNDPDFFASRIAYKLNLKGPALTIQTACSTSLVAVHQACQSLLTYQCDMALSGGACVQVPQGVGYLYQDGMIFSPDGHCRAFDAQANGTVFGQGAGVVLLKRLSEAIEDNDHIIAVIKGSAINNDGALKAGFTAPSVDGQADVIAIAQTVSEVDPDTISYIEAHGTATPLGDPIEIEGLTKAFRQHCQNTNFCAIGSVKTNIGHLDTTAGIAGLIKTALALDHKEIPASLHLTTPNPKIDWENTPFFVNSQLRKWDSNNHPRRAGVSSFGVGGTNAHVILEEAPSQYTERPSRPYHLLLLSARTPTALNAAASDLADFMRDNKPPALADAAYTLQTGRKHFPHRRFTVCRTPDQAHEQLSSPESFAPISAATSAPTGVVFMVSGQGSQYVNMGRDLYDSEPFFRRQIDDCANILKQHVDTDLRSILYPASTKEAEAQRRLIQTDITQPGLFVIEYSLAQLLMHWGIHPTAMVGHSIGEYVAACLSGVFSLEDALRLVTARGRLMYSQPPGAMLAVPLPESEIQPDLISGLSLAVVNGAKNCVLSGTPESIETMQKQFTEKNIHCRRLHTSHAFHSSMMEPILADFEKEVSLAHLNPPRIPFTSNVTGTWVTEEQVLDPNYWARHLRQTVHFFDCMHTLLKNQNRTFIEIGPGQTLCTLTRQHPDCTKEHQVLATLRPAKALKNDSKFLLNTFGRLWELGHKIDWQHFHQKEKRHRVPLPTYHFERKHYWPVSTQTGHFSEAMTETKTSEGAFSLPVQDAPLEEKAHLNPPEVSQSNSRNHIERIIEQIWTNILPEIETLDSNANFFDLGGDSLNAVQLNTDIEKHLGIEIDITTVYESPRLDDFTRVIKKKIRAGNTQASINPNKGSCESTLSSTTHPSLYNHWAVRVVIKIIKAAMSPQRATIMFKAMVVGSFYILWYKLFRPNIRIKFPFFVYSKLKIYGPGKVFIDSGCAVHINTLETPTIVTIHPESTVKIGKKCELAGIKIRCKNRIEIGDQMISAVSLIQDFLLFSDTQRADSSLRNNDSSIILGEHVWLAGQAAVLAGGKICRGGVLSIKSVLHDSEIGEFSIGSGNPAKELYRRDDTKKDNQ
jgi:acyl transferase domain-containing protein/acetyltransferase-like isoleucine patch superfamily enzyme